MQPLASAEFAASARAVTASRVAMVFMAGVPLHDAFGACRDNGPAAIRFHRQVRRDAPMPASPTGLAHAAQESCTGIAIPARPSQDLNEYERNDTSGDCATRLRFDSNRR